MSELKVAVENLKYLNKAAFATDKQLLSEICSTQGSSSTEPVGVVLVSNKKKWKMWSK